MFNKGLVSVINYYISMMVTLNLTLTSEDYANFNYYTVWQMPGKKTKIIKSRLQAFLIFTLMMLMVKSSSPEKTFDPYFFFSIFVLGSIYLLPLFTKKTDSHKQALKFINNPLNDNLLTQTQVIISETGLFAKDEFSEVKYNWTSIVKKEETTAYYFLYLNSAQAIIIPKRILKSETEKVQLQKLFSQYISFHAAVGHLVKD